jgi:hypothetical protein
MRLRSMAARIIVVAFRTIKVSFTQFFRSIRSAQLIDAETLRLARYGIVTAAENTVTTAMQAAAS